MPDLMRLVRFRPGGQILVDLDVMAAAGPYNRERGTLKFSPPAPAVRTLARARPYGGERPLGVTHGNGSVAMTLWVKGSSPNDAIAQARALVRQVNSFTEGRYIEHRLPSSTYPSYFDLRGPGTLNPQPVNVLAFEQAYLWAFDVTFAVGPCALGAPMDIYDDFANDSSSDYSFDQGDATLMGLGAAGVISFANTGTLEAYHSARGYVSRDQQATAKVNLGGTLTGAMGGVVLRRRADGWRIRVVLDAGAGALRIEKVAPNGTPTTLSTTAYVPTAGRSYYVRGRIEDNYAYAELYLASAPPQNVAEQSPDGAAAELLASTSANVYGVAGRAEDPGYAGVYGRANGTGLTIDELRIEPWTFHQRTYPDVVRVTGIPGDLPALAELHYTPRLGSTAPACALVGWLELPSTFNPIYNGDGEDNTGGWLTAAVAGIVDAATSVTKTSNVAITGSSSLRVVLPVDDYAGPHFTIYRKFRKGVVYTFEIWVRSDAATTQVQGFFGVPGDFQAAADNVNGSVALSTSWRKLTVTWTPAAETELAYVGVRQTTATATTLDIEGAIVTEGDAWNANAYLQPVYPTAGRHRDGAGAPPPFGLLGAENADTSALTGFSVIAGTYNRGYALDANALSGAGSAAAEWLVDPTLLIGDDFSGGDIDVEVYGLMLVTGNPMNGANVTLSAKPEQSAAGGTTRYTAEWGAAGRPLGDITTTDYNYEARRWRRLGTLTFRADPTHARTRVRLAFAWTGATSGRITVDELAFLPARGRLTSPQRVTARNAPSVYPQFAPALDATKIIRADRSGAVKPRGRGAFPDHGLAGEPLELDVGNNELVFIPHSEAVDSPGDPQFNAEATSFSGTLHVSIIPRYYLARGAT